MKDKRSAFVRSGWIGLLMGALVLSHTWAFASKASPSAFLPLATDEFYGPFPSWMNVKRDFGAVGDGKADDTLALQRALDELQKEERRSAVLFLPAGVYRITQTLRLNRESHNQAKDIAIIGEDPEKTVIRWDGEEGGVMLYYNAWYSRLGRLTFDGGGKANTAILWAHHFSTYNEVFDATFKDVGFGIEAGRMDTAGIAETVVVRCRFIRCSRAGISIQNWNSLDWFIWHCSFEDCHIGVTNAFGAGNYHVYESIFRNSTEADITEGHAAYFSIRNNFSTGSNVFFKAGWLDACGEITIQGNIILDPKDVPIQVFNLGPLLLIDNIIKTKNAPAVRVREEAGFLSVGNTFTVEGAIEAKPTALRLEDKFLAHDAVRVPAPPRFLTPPLEKRPLIELERGCPGEKIQEAIDRAVKMKGKRPIVHLPSGVYKIEKTLVIPTNCDVRLVGDNPGDGPSSTILQWVGEGEGPVLKVEGPTQAVIDGLSINGGGKADGLLIANCDQRGARIIADQLNVGGAQRCGMLLNRLRNADVSLFNINHAGCKVAIRVLGRDEEGEGEGRVVIFSGASSNNELSYEVTDGGRLLVRDIWYETSSYPRFALFQGKGTFTLHAGRVATPGKAGNPPVVEINNYDGKVTFINVNLVQGSGEVTPKVLVKGEGKRTKVLLLGCMGDGEDDLLVNQSPYAQVVSLEPFKMLPGGGAQPIPSIGKAEPSFILDMLSQTRAEHPRPLTPLSKGVTDLRLHRLTVWNCQNCVSMTP